MHILLGCVLLDVFKGYVFHVFRCVFEPVLHSSCLAFRCFLEEDVSFRPRVFVFIRDPVVYSQAVAFVNAKVARGPG